MALIPLDTARRITQSPLEGVNQRLMQLMNLKQQEKEAARAERMGNLQARLLQARIKKMDAQTAARKKTALAKIAEGIQKNKEETLRAISKATGNKVNAVLDLKVKAEVADRRKNKPVKTAFSFLDSHPKARELAMKDQGLPDYSKRNEYTPEQKLTLARAAWSVLPSEINNWLYTEVSAGVEAEMMEKMDPDEFRDRFFDQVMQGYGEVIPEETKKEYRKALDFVTPAEMLDSTSAQLADTLFNVIKYGNKVGPDKANAEGEEEEQEQLEDEMVKKSEFVDRVEKRYKQLGGFSGAQKGEILKLIQEAFDAGPKKAFSLLNAMLSNIDRKEPTETPVQEAR